ncbi:MAG: S8 family serine peptidase [Catenulispora sp.]|nr:S8 family serine peptidase [Catenulispora sp.]
MSTRNRATRAAVTLTAFAAVAALTGAAGATQSGPGAIAGGAAGAGTVRPVPDFAGAHDIALLPAPLPTSQCVSQLGIVCYDPAQYRSAYDYNPLYRAGIDGRGRTIVIVDSFGSPTIQHDLDTFDAQFGLPPLTVDIRQTAPIPPYDNSADRQGWAGETTLDVEYAHAMAPGAKIILLETPVSETQGVQGFPEMMAGEKAVIDANEADVISQSFASTENNFPGFAQGDFSSLLNLRFAFQDAQRHGTTVLTSSGDHGTADVDLDGNPYAFPVADWPSSDPLITSVGGTFPAIDDAGHRTAADVVAHDCDFTVEQGCGIVSGGGVSGIFKRPPFQAGVRGVVGNHRGYPDISISGGGANGTRSTAWMYYSYNPDRAGWHLVEGTSESCPLMAATVALADQAAGHRLGNINQALYTLGHLSTLPRFPQLTGLQDVTSGTISDDGVTGASAGPGYDLASGWGTIDAARFVPALAAAGSIG